MTILPVSGSLHYAALHTGYARFICAWVLRSPDGAQRNPGMCVFYTSTTSTNPSVLKNRALVCSALHLHILAGAPKQAGYTHAGRRGRNAVGSISLLVFSISISYKSIAYALILRKQVIWKLSDIASIAELSGMNINHSFID
ncbi:MAG TPA: hypothetical protein ENJ08_16230 [Gammaproteobacteria bacterium]|nr:hypothetical protein [Gammaproteobacteria bacterium]